MKWLLILLVVLKLIGVALLVIISMLLLLLLCGIKYEAKGDYKDGKGYGKGFVSYMFGLVRLDFSYLDDRFDYNLHIPLLPLFNKIKASRKQREVKKKLKLSRQPINRNEGKSVSIMSEAGREDYNNLNNKPKVKKQKKTGFFEGIKKRIGSIKHRKSKKVKQKSILDKVIYYYKKYDIKKLYKPLINFLKRFVRAIGIKKADADIVFGFEDPSLTGMVLGGGAAVAAFLPIRLNLDGNFEGEYLCAKANIRGRTSIIGLLIPVIRLLLEKPVWELLTNLKG